MRLVTEVEGVTDWTNANSVAVHRAMKQAVDAVALNAKTRTRAIVRSAWPRGGRHAATAIRSMTFDDRVSPTITSAHGKRDAFEIEGGLRVGRLGARGLEVGGAKVRGAYTAIVYSRLGRGKGPGFIDYTALQGRGGRVAPGGYMFVPFGRSIAGRRRLRANILASPGPLRAKGFTLIKTRDKYGRKAYVLFRLSKAKSRSRRGKPVGKPLAIFVQETRHPKRLSYESVEAAIGRDLPATFVDFYDREAQAGMRL